VLLGVDYEKGNVTYVQTNWTSQSENSGKWCSVNAVTTSTFARFAEQYATLDYAYVYRGYREAFSEATDPIPEENPLPEEDHGSLLTTESVSAYMQTRGVGALKDFRVIFVCSEAVLYRFEELKVSVTFSLEDGSVKSYHGTLGINADDFTLTRTVHAGDALFQADEGCLLFGKAIVDIPADTVDRVTVTLRDTDGTVVFSGGISFEK
jgi:hypothetical protein